MKERGGEGKKGEVGRRGERRGQGEEFKTFVRLSVIL